MTATPSPLAALLSQWRKESASCHHRSRLSQGGDYDAGCSDAYDNCADDIEGLLADSVALVPVALLREAAAVMEDASPLIRSGKIHDHVSEALRDVAARLRSCCPEGEGEG